MIQHIHVYCVIFFYVYISHIYTLSYFLLLRHKSVRLFLFNTLILNDCRCLCAIYIYALFVFYFYPLKRKIITIYIKSESSRLDENIYKFYKKKNAKGNQKKEDSEYKNTSHFTSHLLPLCLSHMLVFQSFYSHKYCQHALCLYK